MDPIETADDIELARIGEAIALGRAQARRGEVMTLAQAKARTLAAIEKAARQ